MKLTLFFDHRFLRSTDGVLYSPTSYNYDLFTGRYLSVFDELTIVARVQDHPHGNRGGKHAEGPGVHITPVGNWQGPIQYARERRHVRRTVEDELRRAEAVMMIAPGRIGQVATDALLRAPRPYGLEVVGDPSDVFAPGASNHPLRPFLQQWATRELRKQAGAATSVAYVSRVNLPERYPAGKRAFVTHYSSIELRDEHFVDRIEPVQIDRDNIRLVTVGTLSQMYKGIDVIIDALPLLEQARTRPTLTIVGDGRFRNELESRAEAAGMRDRVHFLGHLPAGDAVRSELDKADLFVLASRTEGLPRAMIEAMARGKPCIGTRVGGIPELLPPEDMVEPGNPQALANKISEVIGNPARLEAMAKRNLDTARSYRASILSARRTEMYSNLKEQTRQWMNRHGR